MPDEIASLSAHFANAPSIFASSPLYRAFCPVVAGDRTTLALLTDRRAGQQPSYLLFGAVHCLLLGGVRHPLRDFYPSLAGDAALPPEDSGPALLDFCRAHPAELRDLIRTRLVQTNVVKRVFGLRMALATLPPEPVHLVEVGSSAGVHLYADRYRYEIGGRVYGRSDATVSVSTEWRGQGPPPDLDAVPPIASRVGIDLNPVDITDAAERLWLRALVWPEDGHKADLLAAALDGVAKDPPPLLAGDAAEVCRSLSLPRGEPRVVFHSAVRMHVPQKHRAAFDAAIDALGSEGPLYHVWQEPPTAPHTGFRPAPLDAIMCHGPDGRPTPVVRAEGHLEWAAPA